MRSNPRRWPASVILVVSVAVSPLEWTAFGQNPNVAVPSAHEKPAAGGALKLSALALPPMRVPAPAAAAWRNQAAAQQDETPKKKRGVLKWILIGAGAGVAASIIATQSSGPRPVITVGPPVVEAPQ